MCVCVCVCVCVRARACVCACVRVRARARVCVCKIPHTLEDHICESQIFQQKVNSPHTYMAKLLRYDTQEFLVLQGITYIWTTIFHTENSCNLMYIQHIFILLFMIQAFVQYF